MVIAAGRRVGGVTGGELGRLSGMSTSMAFRLSTRRVPLLLAFVLGAVLVAPAGVGDTPAADPSAVASASASQAVAAPTVHVDTDRSSTVSATATPQTATTTAIVKVAARMPLDGGLRIVPAPRGPPPLSA
jgi:hypothetical protein